MTHLSTTTTAIEIYKRHVHKFATPECKFPRTLVAANTPARQAGQFQLFVWSSGKVGHVAVRNIASCEYVSFHGGAKREDREQRNDVRGYEKKGLDVSQKEAKFRSFKQDVKEMGYPSSSHIVDLPLPKTYPTTYDTPSYYRVADSVLSAGDHSNCVDALKTYLASFTECPKILKLLNECKPDPRSVADLAKSINATKDAIGI